MNTGYSYNMSVSEKNSSFAREREVGDLDKSLSVLQIGKRVG